MGLAVPSARARDDMRSLPSRMTPLIAWFRMADTKLSTDEVAAVQKRTIRVLMLGVIPAGAASSGGYAAAATLGEELTGSDTLGGLAAACLTLGGALATLPLFKLMARRGRRIGMRAVWSIGAAGSIVSFVAAVADLYLLLVPGLIAMGSAAAGTLAARYAAADLAAEDQRARAIGSLMWGLTLGAVLGPTLALGPASDVARSLGLPELSGPFVLSAVLFAGAALAVDTLLRPDPLELLGGLTEGEGSKRQSVIVAMRAIWMNPSARLAVAAMVAGHAVMVAVMTATPLHMKDGDHELRIVGFVISLHVVGMYLFAPVVGRLVDRIGPRMVIAAGGGILFAGAELAAHAQAQHSAGVFSGLFLIGLGWSFGVVAASTLLTQSVALPDRVGVQGAADFLMVGAGATAGLFAGIVIEQFGYYELSHYSGLLGLVLTLLVGSSFIATRRHSTVGATTD